MYVLLIFSTFFDSKFIIVITMKKLIIVNALSQGNVRKKMMMIKIHLMTIEYIMSIMFLRIVISESIQFFILVSTFPVPMVFIVS